MPFKWSVPILTLMKVTSVTGVHAPVPSTEPTLQSAVATTSVEHSAAPLIDSATADLDCDSNDEVANLLFFSLRTKDSKGAVELVKRHPSLLSCHEKDALLPFVSTTPIQAAASSGQIIFLEAIQNRVLSEKFLERDFAGRAPLHLSKSESVTRFLLDILPKDNWFPLDLGSNSPLHEVSGYAAGDGEKKRIVKLLLDAYTPIQILQKNEKGDNFLHIFMRYGGSLEYVESLVPRDLFVHLVIDKNLAGETPEDQVIVYKKWRRKLMLERRLNNPQFG